MATAQEILNLTVISGMCRSELLGSGVEVEIVSNIAEYEARLEAIGKPENHKVISSFFHDMTSDDAFGLVLKHAGEDIGGVAARLLRLGGTSLADYWRSSSKRLYGSNEVEVVGRITPAAERISGKVVYEGELFLGERYRGHQVNLSAVMFNLHVLSALMWKPDWIYGFIRLRHVSKIGKYGFTGFYVGAQEWLRSIDRRNADECLVTLDAAGLHDAVAHYVREPASFFGLQMGKE